MKETRQVREDLQDDLEEWEEFFEKTTPEMDGKQHFVVEDPVDRQKKYDSAVEFDRYAKRHGGGIPSFLFVPGELVEESLLRVKGPGYVNRFGRPTWKKVECVCECGNTVIVLSASLRQTPPRYSCGCRERVRWNEKDYTGKEYYNARQKKTVTVLCREPAGGWLYCCDCCARIGVVPRGGLKTFEQKLKEIAARPCVLKNAG